MNVVMQRRLSLSLYLNYFVHGIGLIILAQNMQALGHLWQAPLATVSYVISGVGIGRLIAYLALGALSDRYGRKNFVYLGMASYFVFFIGMLLAPNIQVAYLLAIVAGIANSALDSGTYTTFIELGGNQGASNVLIKAFMSLGEFLLPLFVAFLETNRQWFGWSFVAAAAVLLLNFFLLRPVKFPPANQAKQTQNQAVQNLSQGRKRTATAALALYGYTSMALMSLFTQWITLYASQTRHMDNVAAHFLLSLYSIGSIVGVLIMFWLLKKQVSDTLLLLSLNAAALIALTVICFVNIPWLMYLASFVFGLTAASGIMQVGLNTFLKLYPKIKGLVTGIFFTFGSVASFTIPVITGWLSSGSVAAALRFDLFIASACLILAIVVRTALGGQETLADRRRKISHLDRLIVRLLVHRFQTVDSIGQLKRQNKEPILDQTRETEVLDRIADNCSDTQFKPYLQDIYGKIMDVSKDYQRDQRKD